MNFWLYDKCDGQWRTPRKYLALQAFVRLYAQIPSDFLNALRLNERSPTGRTARAVNVIQSHFAERSCSWNIFAYDLLPNQLRPTDLLLGQVSIFSLAPLGFA